MYNKKVLSTALKNLNKTKGPVKKKDSLYPMDNNYQFNDNMPMMKEGGSKNFVNSKDHGVDTPVYIKTEEKSSPIHGTGVFTKQPVTKGQIIGVSHIRKEFERDGQMYQAPFPSKTIGGYNHSESPNVTEVDNGDHIVMIALKDIKPGEELVSNYYESNIDDLEKPEDFKNELTKANGGLQVAKEAAKKVSPLLKNTSNINISKLVGSNAYQLGQLIKDANKQIQLFGQDELASLSSPEGIRRLKLNYKNLNPSLTDAQLDAYVANTLNEVKLSFENNTAAYLDRFKPHITTDSQGYNNIDWDLVSHFMPYSNAHHASLPYIFRSMELGEDLGKGVNYFKDPFWKRPFDYHNYMDQFKLDSEKYVDPVLLNDPNSQKVVRRKITPVYQIDNYLLNEADFSLTPGWNPGYMGFGLNEINPRIFAHELGHGIQRGGLTNTDLDLHKAYFTNKSYLNNPLLKFFNDRNINDPQFAGDLEYFRAGSNWSEPYPFAREMRQGMVDEGLLSHRYDFITPGLIRDFQHLNTGDRLSKLTPSFKRRTLANILNNAPAVGGLMLGTGLLNENSTDEEYKTGGYIEAELSKEEIQKYLEDGYIVEEIGEDPHKKLGQGGFVEQELPKADRGIVSLGKKASKILTPLVEETASLTKYFPNQFKATSNLGKFVGSTGNIDLDQLKAAIGKESMGLTHKWPILEKQLIKEFGDMPTSLPLSEIQRVTNDAIVPYTMNLNPRGRSDYGVFDEGIGGLGLGFTKRREALTWTDKERNQYNAAQSYLQHFDLLKDAMEIGNISVPTYKSKVDETLSNIGRRPGSLFYGSGVSTIEDLQSIINKWDNPEIYEPLSQQTNVLSGLGEGSQRHNNPKGTLAAAHSYIDPDTPDTRTYTQLQSDALQGTHHIWKDKEKKLKKTQEDFQSLQKDVDLLNQVPEGEDLINIEKMLLEKSLNNDVFKKYGLNTYQEALDIFPRQIANAENEIIAVKGPNPKQKELLEKNWESVLLQQLMSEAAAEGMTKIRVPTGETSIKIQNYKKIPQWTGEEENMFDPGNVWETITRLAENISTNSSFKELKPQVYDYTDQQKSVIRRYNKLPKTLKKSFGYTDDQIKTVTDRNGNTWYEVEIPESFLQGQGQIIHKYGGSLKLPKANGGLQVLKNMTKSAKPIVDPIINTFNTFKGLTNMSPILADLSRVNYINNVYPGTLELISDLKNSNIISPTLNETTLATNPNLLNLVTKRGIQDALTFTRSTTPSVFEGLSSSGTRTPISNLDMGNFIKYGLVGDDPGLAMYTASHVPGMRYGRRDALEYLPYKTIRVGNADQGTPESLDALYTHPQITGIPQGVQKGIFGDTYGSYASILRYPFDYSGSASDMFDRYKTFENKVFDKGRLLRDYRGSKDAAAGDIGALNFVNKPTWDNRFYQSIFSDASEVPFIGHPGQKVLEPVATYTKPIVQEIKDEFKSLYQLYKKGNYKDFIDQLNKKVKSGEFGSVESNIKAMEIDPKYPVFDSPKYHGIPEAAMIEGTFDPKTGLIKTKGDLKSIAWNALSAYHSYMNFVNLQKAFRDPTNVVKYPYSPLKYKFKKGGELPKANRGQVAKTLGLKSSANILDDLLVRTRGLWQTPEGISRLNQMITNTPALSSLNVTPEIMVNDLSNLTNLNHISSDVLKQRNILQEKQNALRDELNKLKENNASEWEINKQIAAKRRNKYELFNLNKKIDALENYYGRGGKYTEPANSWETRTNPFGHSIVIDRGLFTAADLPMIGMHEIGHFPGMYYGKLSSGPETYHTYLDDMLSGLKLKSDSELAKQIVDYGTPLKYNMGNIMTGAQRMPLRDQFGNVIPNQFEHPLLSAKNYFKNNLEEKSPFLAEVREKMLQDNFIKHPYEIMTPTKLQTYYNNYNNITGNKYPLRYFDIMKPKRSNFKLTSDVFNKMLIGLPAVGAATLGSDLDEKSVGGPMLGDPPVVEDPLPITPDSELDKAQKFIRDWYNNRTLAPIDDPRYTKIMTQSLEDAKERVKRFPQYTPLITDDPTARGTYIGGKNPQIQVVPNLDPEEDTLTKLHELTTYVNEPLTENPQYQDIYGNIIKQNVKSFKEGWGNLTGADKKAAKQFYNYVTDPSEDNIHSYMMNARRIFDVSPDQVVTEADIENWKKTAEDAGMLDKNSENYNDELYILFKLAKDNKSMTNMFNYLAMDESPQMEGGLQRADKGVVVKALSTLGKVAPEISAISNLTKSATPLINATVPLVNTTFKFVPEVTKADWANWNKATPHYSKLMQEYADIEESTKGMGTWMKNADGTPYLGSPLQFIQEQSENFKNAFPEGYLKTYRGVNKYNAFRDFSKGRDKGFTGDRAIFTANKLLADKYADYHKGTRMDLNSSIPDNVQGTYSLIYPRGKHIIYDATGKNWSHLGGLQNAASNSLSELESLNKFIQERLFPIGHKYYDSNSSIINTDVLAQYLPTTNLNSIILNNLIDSGRGNVHIVNNRMKTKNGPFYLKSTFGNDGFFRMDNPNIYKSLGGESNYELGDEVDEATMEKLKKGGYTFEEI